VDAFLHKDQRVMSGVRDFNSLEGNVDQLFELANEIDTTGQDWADKTHAANVLEETKTTVRAEIALSLRREKGLNKRDADEEALVHPRYKEHVDAMLNARHAANIARVRLEACKARYEAMRTAEVSRRAELNRLSSR
jgi:hypothetical protein